MGMIRALDDATQFVTVVEAVRAQRRYWRSIRLTELDLVDFEALQHAATAVAQQLEKRFQYTASKGWQRWCKNSLANGASSIIQWSKRPERELEVAALEAPQAKLSRIQGEWMTIWGDTADVTAPLEAIQSECTPPPPMVPPTRSTSHGVEVLHTPRWSAPADAPSTRGAGLEESLAVSSTRRLSGADYAILLDDAA